MSINQRTNVAFAAIALAGGLLLLINWGQPLLRNSFFYAKMSFGLIDSGFDMASVLNNPLLSYFRPTGFAVIAAPAVFALGAQAGLRVTGYLSALLFVYACLLFFRQFRDRFEIPESAIPWLLILTVANPLVMYQFWAAYPDVLFAALVVGVVVLMDRILCSPENMPPLRIVAVAVLIYAAITIKHYGLILFPMAATLAVGQWRSVLQLLRRGTSLAAICGALVGLGALLVIARYGMNPTLNLQTHGPMSEFVSGLVEHAVPLADNTFAVLVFLLVLLNVAILFVVYQRRPSRLPWPVVIAFAVFIAGLLGFIYAYRNIRYFLPATPIVIALAARGYLSVRRHRLVARGVGGVAVAVTVVLTLNYNVPFVYEAFGDINQHTVERRQWDRVLDSLHMGQHLARRTEIDGINSRVEYGATMYYVSSYYYDSSHHIYERDGLFRPDLILRYEFSLKRALADAVGTDVYIYTPREPLPASVLPYLGLVSIGPSLYRTHPTRPTIPKP